MLFCLGKLKIFRGEGFSDEPSGKAEREVTNFTLAASRGLALGASLGY
jgi:hypothetical protein